MLRKSLTAAMQLSEDLNIELEALQAIYDSAVTVTTDSAADHSHQGSGSANGEHGSQVELQLQLAPQTGGDDSSVYVLATLGISVPSDYPQQPPTCSLVTAKGSASSLSQAAAATCFAKLLCCRLLSKPKLLMACAATVATSPACCCGGIAGLVQWAAS